MVQHSACSAAEQITPAPEQITCREGMNKCGIPRRSWDAASVAPNFNSQH